MDKTLFFNGVGQFEIKDGEFLIPFDEIEGWECMKQTDYDSFMAELEKRKHIWFNSWNKQCQKDYEEFYNYAKTYKI